MKPVWIASLVVLATCRAENDRLVDRRQIVADAIPVAMTDMPGDAGRGVAVFSGRDDGHCVLCHVVDGLDVPFQGDVGPDLSDVGSRLDAGQLRLRIVDYQLVRPGALMPSYYRVHGLYRVAEAYDRQPVLSAQEVEDLVAYLGTLKVDQDVPD